MNSMRRFCFLMIVVFGLLAPLRMSAYDLPPVNLGFTSFLDGAPPAGPGFYFAQYLQYYYADKFADQNGNNLTLPIPNAMPNPQVNAFISLSQVLYQSNQKILLGGKWGMDFILPIVGFDLSGAAPFSANSPGLGDILIGPYLQWDPIMGKKGPIFMHRLEFQCVLPSGKYSANQELNPGSGFFSFDPYWAGTVFVTPKWTTSWRVHYLWNAESSDPNRFLQALYGAQNFQAGQAVHLNFATEYELIANRWRLGLNGYYLKQVTDTQINSHGVSDRLEQVLGIGPGTVYHFSKNDHLFFNLYFETAVENRTEGIRSNLRFVHHF